MMYIAPEWTPNPTLYRSAQGINTVSFIIDMAV